MGGVNGASLAPAVTEDEARKIEIDCTREARSFRPTTEQVDPKRVFLLRAAARHEMVERGELALDAAFDADFVGAFLAIALEFSGLPNCDVCAGGWCSSPTFCALCLQADRKQADRKRWGRR
jgi:hypothetical protein